MWLRSRGIKVKAHDPAIRVVPDELRVFVDLCETADQAFAGADLLVVATEWPAFRNIQPAQLLSTMRLARVVDQTWFLSQQLCRVPGLRYFAPGRAEP
jgi:UDPglucose 6-dehydrogenase